MQTIARAATASHEKRSYIHTESNMKIFRVVGSVIGGIVVMICATKLEAPLWAAYLGGLGWMGLSYATFPKTRS